jgi:hypothetical protein
MDDRDVIGLGERGDAATERVPDLLQARRRGDREPAMLQEPDHLSADLQLPEI